MLFHKVSRKTVCLMPSHLLKITRKNLEMNEGENRLILKCYKRYLPWCIFCEGTTSCPLKHLSTTFLLPPQCHWTCAIWQLSHSLWPGKLICFYIVIHVENSSDSLYIFIIRNRLPLASWLKKFFDCGDAAYPCLKCLKGKQ